jgi:hypothetical protein
MIFNTRAVTLFTTALAVLYFPSPAHTKTLRGRDAGYPAPPAQIPASGTTALGSYLR